MMSQQKANFLNSDQIESTLSWCPGLNIFRVNRLSERQSNRIFESRWIQKCDDLRRFDMINEFLRHNLIHVVEAIFDYVGFPWTWTCLRHAYFLPTVNNKKIHSPVFQPFDFPVYLQNLLSYKPRLFDHFVHCIGLLYFRGKKHLKNNKYTVINKKTHRAVFETCVFRIYLQNHLRYKKVILICLHPCLKSFQMKKEFFQFGHKIS